MEFRRNHASPASSQCVLQCSGLKKSQVCALFLDISKVFDTVEHTLWITCMQMIVWFTVFIGHWNVLLRV